MSTKQAVPASVPRLMVPTDAYYVEWDHPENQARYNSGWFSVSDLKTFMKNKVGRIIKK